MEHRLFRGEENHATIILHRFDGICIGYMMGESWIIHFEDHQDHQDHQGLLRLVEVMMANERVNEDEAEAILSNLKMEGRSLDRLDRWDRWDLDPK